MYRSFTKYLVLTLFIGLFSCENNEKVDEFDSEKFIPQSKRDYDFDESEDTLSVKSGELSIETFREVVELITGGEEWIEVKKNIYLHRFGVKNEITLEMISDVDTSYWYLASYKDTTFSQNAFYNWLDCFGENCTSLKIDDEIVFRKSHGQVWWTDTLIIYYESKGKNISKKQRESISNYFKENLRIHFYWDKNQKFKWTIVENQSEV